MTKQSIDASTFKTLLEEQRVEYCLDVRTPAEWRSRRLKNCINLPLEHCSTDTINELTIPEKATVYLICASGRRAQMAQENLANASQAIVVVEGGLTACENVGITLEEKTGVISLERQVRIAAGTLVVTGTLIGSLAHPAGFGISAFVGAGLIFAGITDTCGMALLLARMPWNR